jgi:hypothetical protein
MQPADGHQDKPIEVSVLTRLDCGRIIPKPLIVGLLFLSSIVLVHILLLAAFLNL